MMSDNWKNAKEQIISIVSSQPDDSTLGELLREIHLARVVERGLADVAAGREMDQEEARRQAQSWFK